MERDFESQSTRIRRRLGALREHADAASPAQAAWLDEAIEALALSLREMEVAQATLTRQREELQRVRQRRDEMRWLLDASRAVLECHTFEASARRIFNAAREVTGAVSGYVALLNQETGENDVLFLEAGGLPCDVDPDLPMPVRGLRAEAYTRMEVVYDNDFKGSPYWAFIPPGHVVLHNVLFAPLTLEGAVVGVIGLANKPGDFTDDDARAATVLGDMAAVALERTRTEEVVRRYAADLKESNCDLARFADAVSHDLREPARMVEIFLELLQTELHGQLNRQAHQYLDYAMNGAQRMRAMIGGLLDLSRVQSRGEAFAMVDAERILTLTLLALDRMIDESGAEVTYDPLPSVRADAAQLGEVFQNLIANAIKFQEEGSVPRVHISARRLSASPPRSNIQDKQGEEGWCFSVQDNGIGIDPTQADIIFEVFKRLHSEEAYPGLGVGLAICKRIVERHGGEIWMESEPGMGATFYFTLPAAVADIRTDIDRRPSHDTETSRYVT